MSMFTLICHLTTSNLPWFTSLPLQVPMQYCFCSIGLYFHYQSHPELGIVFPLAPLFCFGSVSSFFLELVHHFSPVAYWAPTDWGSSSFSLIPFDPFILFMGFPDKNAEVVFHCLLQWTKFCQNSPPIKNKTEAGCSPDHELLTAKFRLKCKKVRKTTRLFRHDLIKSLMIIHWKWQIDSRD